MVFNLQMEYTV